MKVSIYQINTNRDHKRVCFLNTSSLEKMTGSDIPDISIYDKVYEFYDSQPDELYPYLEGIYHKFNADTIPSDYTGRSMSVSDIVSLEIDGSVKYYFCDSIGFKEVDINKQERRT